MSTVVSRKWLNFYAWVVSHTVHVCVNQTTLNEEALRTLKSTLVSFSCLSYLECQVEPRGSWIWRVNQTTLNEEALRTLKSTSVSFSCLSYLECQFDTRGSWVWRVNQTTLNEEALWTLKSTWVSFSCLSYLECQVENRGSWVWMRRLYGHLNLFECLSHVCRISSVKLRLEVRGSEWGVYTDTEIYLSVALVSVVSRVSIWHQRFVGLNEESMRTLRSTLVSLNEEAMWTLTSISNQSSEACHLEWHSTHNKDSPALKILSRTRKFSLTHVHNHIQSFSLSCSRVLT